MINYSILNIIVGFSLSSDEKSKVRFTSSSCGDFDQENKAKINCPHQRKANGRTTSPREIRLAMHL